MAKPGQKCITVPKRVFDKLRKRANEAELSIPKLIEYELCEKKED